MESVVLRSQGLLSLGPWYMHICRRVSGEFTFSALTGLPRGNIVIPGKASWFHWSVVLVLTAAHVLTWRQTTAAAWQAHALTWQWTAAAVSHTWFWFLLICFYYYFMCLGVLPACMSVKHMHALCLWRPEDSAGSPETGVIDGSEVGAGNSTQVLCKCSQCS